ncbi:MAG: ABC transporter permease [Bacteroidales bacterium]|nr:ABC transporter permease [Bacteroidales bacterium]
MARIKQHGKTRLWGELTSMVFSITLVLFVLGALLFIEYHSYLTTHQMQERITYKVDLVPEVSDSTALALQQQIQGFDYVKNVDYISREQAAELFSEEIGDEFVDFLGYNPLYPSLMVNFKSGLLPEKDKNVIEGFTKEVGSNPDVTGVVYQENVVDELNDLFYKISWFLIIFISLLLFISVVLINNTIKLAIYATQSTIQTMQLVGAKRSFIARPFLWRSALLGLLGGVIADGLLVAVVYSFSTQFSLQLMIAEHMVVYSVMAGIVPLAGILIAYFSTLFSINHYLKKKIK